MSELTSMFFLSMLSADPPDYVGCKIADDVEDPPDWNVQDVEGDMPNCDVCPISHACNAAYQTLVVEVAYEQPKKKSKLLERLIKKNNGG